VRRVAHAGYSVVHDAGPTATFAAKLLLLGDLCDEFIVRVAPAARKYVCDWPEVPFHTDDPTVDLIAWYCEAQDDWDGASVLVDSQPVLARLHEQARTDLRQTLLPFRALAPHSTAFWPVLSESGQIFLMPWLEPTSPRHRQEGSAFVAFVGSVLAQRPVRIRLRPGQALIIDNRRMLHGRSAIHPQSRRRLRRYWVRLRRQPP
jgi:hypothetical protein